MTTRTVSLFSSFWDWLHDRLLGYEDRESERQRLAKLAAHQELLQKQAEESGVTTFRRQALSDQDRDNYLRGELISADHDFSEKHNRETVSQWLHLEEDAAKKPVAPAIDCQPARQRTTGELDYKINETRLLEFTDIGMGMDKTCLSSFISHQQTDGSTEAPPPVRSTRELMMMRRTVKDIPALESRTIKEFDFRPLEEAQNTRSK